MRVLVVSSDAAERSRAASALRMSDDVEVVEAAGGPTAAALLREGGYDVLVVDGDLRPKGGFSWLYELRAQAQLHGLTRPPAIVMTSREQDQYLADWAGAEVIVRKPVDGFEMAARVVELAQSAADPA